jgi:hypothetical protein
MQYSLAYQLGERSGGLDPDAKAYIAAVEFEDGQALESGVRKAINNFVVGCKVDGIWSAIKASCILAGARTLDGALVPLVGTAPTNNNFVSGDYNRETGLIGDASTKYLDSNRNNNADPQDSYHQAVYVTTGPTVVSGVTTSYIGAGAISTGASQITHDSVAGGTMTWRSRFGAPTPIIVTSTGNPTGFIGLRRSSSSTHVRRIGGADTSVGQTSEAPHNGNVLVFARNSATNVAGLFSNGRMAFYSIGESLDLALLDTRVSTLMTDLAAAIP